MKMDFENQISIDFPLKGEWRSLRPPGHHPYAFDFVKMDDKKQNYFQDSKIKYFLSTISADQYYSWGQPVYSPIDGTVLKIGTSWKDHLKTNIWKMIKIWYDATYKTQVNMREGRLDIRPNVGNYIMIQAKEGYIVFLAHLQNNSIKIKQGQIIKSGHVLAKVGNSGNSTAPHLHLNLFDQMDNPLQAEVIPFVFNKYEELINSKWNKCSLNVPQIRSFLRK